LEQSVSLLRVQNGAESSGAIMALISGWTAAFAANSQMWHAAKT
jgi:hypothetical protein